MPDEDVEMEAGRDSGSLAEFQRLLPHGLTLAAPLAQSHSLGQVFVVLDRRGVEEPIRRRIWFLTATKMDDAEWQQPLRERLQILLERSWPYVAEPREAGELAGGLYLVEELPSRTLSSCLKTDACAFHSRINDQILGQVLTGLSALHRRGIAHGDLQPKHLFLTEAPLQRGDGKRTGPIASVGDTALGGLAWWSKGRFLDPESAAYYPPEWKREPHEPSFQADLYALGRLGQQLTHGVSVAPLLTSGNRTGTASWLVGLWQKLCDVLWATPTEALSRRLIHREFSDAHVALESYHRLQNWAAWRRVILPMGLALVLSLTGLWTAWAGWNDEAREGRTLAKDAKELQEHLGNTERDGRTKLDRSRADLAARDRELSRTRSELAEVQKTLAQYEETPALTSEDSARRIWISIWEDPKLSGSASLREMQRRYESLLKGSPQEKEMAPHLGKWLKSTKDLIRDGFPWLDSNNPLKGLLRQGVRAPWERSLDEARTHYENLSKAGLRWSELARNPDQSFAMLSVAIQDETKGVQDIFNGWLAAVAKQTSWTVQLTKGSASDSDGTYRGVWVAQRENAAWHNWDLPTKHTYPGKGQFNGRVPFKWKAGEPLVVTMEGARGYLIYRFAMISQTIPGPLAIWELHRLGQVSGDGCVLHLEVMNCPGPPRELYKPLPQKPLTSIPSL